MLLSNPILLGTCDCCFFSLQTFVCAIKDDMRELGANLYALILCNQSDESRILEALDNFHTALADKVMMSHLKKNHQI